MSPLGKFTLSMIGLRFLGANGFFIGLLLGHMFVDRTIISDIILKKLSQLDDNIRILLPYKVYTIYHRLDGWFFGKIFSSILGAVLFGLNGFIAFFIMGHFLFDTPNSIHARLYRQKLDDFFDNNWGKISGFVFGFVLKSPILVFVGIVLGFFVDYYRLEKVSFFGISGIKKFVANFNPIRLWRDSNEARHVAYIQAIAGLAAKISKADGAVSHNEISVFKNIFLIKDDDNSKVAKVFNIAKESIEGYEVYAYQLNKITRDNLNLQENVMENLFKIATADGKIKKDALDMLTKIAEILEFPMGNFDVMCDIYQPKAKNDTLQNFYDILGLNCNVSDREVKLRWKLLIIENHPDRIQAQGATKDEMDFANNMMARINNAYQEILKDRNL